MLRLISIDNISGSAYRMGVPEWDHSLRFETPARIYELAAAHHCDAALLPVVGLPTLGEEYEALGNYGIACRGPVQSVQLFSQRPLERLLHQRMPIYATPKSRSSIELFRILCLQQYGLMPNLTTSYPVAEAHLLIGDAAFEYAQRDLDTQHHIDLSGWWFEQMGVPFVFARWVVSKSLPQAQRDALSKWIESCVQCAERPEGLEAMSDPVAQGDDPVFRKNYFKQLRYRLTEEDLSGMETFLRLMKGNQYDRTARSA